jgi:hypothetical protein
MLALFRKGSVEAYPQWNTLCLARSGFVTLSGSQFKHLWADVGATASSFNGHPLSNLNPARRGALFQEWAREMLQRTYPNSLIADAVPGSCVNGTRRSRHQAEYDFMMNQQKVEIKGGQLLFDKVTNGWKIHFRAVKFPHLMPHTAANFDDLYLVIFSPKWLHLVKHDMCTGISAAGLLTPICGHAVHIAGASNTNWENSLEAILGKLCEQGGCSLVGKTDIMERWIASLCEKHAGFGDHFYLGKPFASMNPQLRGCRVEKLVLEVDRSLHNDSIFSLPFNERTFSGRRRGHNAASVDWIRDGTRIEVKHGKLVFNDFEKRWLCTFYSVKLDSFDELLLAIYSPRGLDVFKHDGVFGLASTGKVSDTAGIHVKVRAPCRELDPFVALQHIQTKLESNNCPRIASILWDR